jgi:hypothetical protein
MFWERDRPGMHPGIADGDGILSFQGRAIHLEKYSLETFAKEVEL